MAISIVLALALQQLEVSPFPAEKGQEIVLRVGDEQNRPVGGVAIVREALARKTGGGRAEVGVTDARGELRLVAAEEGSWCYRAEVAGVRLLAPHEVIRAPKRLWYALACVPLGLAVLWRAARAVRPRRKDADGSR
ncbi:MAG: hypothetical protein Fur0037_13580 [Planctomycetota bacterium]